MFTNSRPAAVWPGRINRHGRRIRGFICDSAVLPILERIKWQEGVGGYQVGYVGKTLAEMAGIKPGNYKAHRLVWLLYGGQCTSKLYKKGLSVDHVNGLKFDNRIVNLRPMTRSGQGRNNRNASGFYKKPNGRYVASVQGCRGRIIHLGVFDTLEEAADAYQSASELFQLVEVLVASSVYQGSLRPEDAQSHREVLAAMLGCPMKGGAA